MTSMAGGTAKCPSVTRSAIAGWGVAAFVLVVGYLHIIQPGYDPRWQLMSELALGREGALLVVAFLGLGLATGATADNVYRHDGGMLLTWLLGLASLTFCLAGIITLADSAELHVLCVAVAFVACGLGMYLLPRQVASFANGIGYITSWGAGTVLCVSTALSGTLIWPGIAQRIATLALLLWLSFVAWRLASRTCTKRPDSLGN